MPKHKYILYKIDIVSIMLILTAYTCSLFRIFYSHANNSLLFTSSGIYILFFTLWGFTLYYRVLQPKTRHYLTSSAALMICWIVMSTVRQYLTEDKFVQHWLWHLYFLPIMMIPLFSVFIATSLCHSENFKFPKNMKFIYVPVVLLLIAVLTNDYHNLVFDFPLGAEAHSITGYKYGILYYAMLLMISLFIIYSIACIISKNRLPRIKTRIIPPIALFILLIIYSVLYILEVSFIIVWLGDMPVISSLLIASIYESFLRLNLIQTNTHYLELFAAAHLSAHITDNDYLVQHSSYDAQPVSKDLMIKSENHPILLDKDRQLNNMPISGGHIIWSSDISDLIRLRENLKETHDELKERNALLKYKYEYEKKRKIIEEQNRLYDILQRKTQNQLNKISRLVKLYQHTDNKADKEEILPRIIILGSFIKRCKDLVLSTDASSELQENKLANALAESYRSLSLLGIKGSYLVDTHMDFLPGEILISAYDFFEDFIETTVDNLEIINTRVCPVNGNLRVSILANTISDFDKLIQKYPKAHIYTDEDSTFAYLELNGGISH